jgi:hypothetical protein
MKLEPLDRLKFVEERRKSTEGVLWQLPSLSIAAQAFLLSAGLQHDATDWARILAGSLGILAVLATGFVVAFQAVRMSLLGRWIEKELGAMFDEATFLRALEKGGGRRLNRMQKALLKLPTPFWFWAFVLAGFLAADGIMLANGL